MSLSGLKDVDREILKYVDDKDLLKVCSTNIQMWRDVCDDNFLKRRLLSKYPGTEKYKNEKKSWKQFYLFATYYISKMLEDFGFHYKDGNFKTQYELLKIFTGDGLLFSAAKEGDLFLVEHSLRQGADIHTYDDYALNLASQNGHLEVVKWLIKHGADIHAEDDQALRWASGSGQLDVVKYQGADINADNNFALEVAIEKQHREVATYLAAQQIEKMMLN